MPRHGKHTRLRNRVAGPSARCTYCGRSGHLTVDHVPPISLFDGRDRPEGLEVPACEACHQGTREIDAVASFLSRIFPDPATAIQRADVDRSITGFLRNFQALASELGSGEEYILPNGEIAHSFRVSIGAQS